MKQIIIDLNGDVKYALNGEQETFSRVVFVAPRPRQRAIYYAITSAVNSSMIKNSKRFSDSSANDDKQPSENEGGSDIDSLRSMLPAIIDNYGDVTEQCRKLLIDSCCFVDDAEQTKITGPILDSLTIEQYDKIVGEYICYFLLHESMRPQSS